jgi:hypothetical protein
MALRKISQIPVFREDMSIFEERMRTALEEIETLKTSECLDPVSIGLFAEGRLSVEEKRRAEKHLLTCLYCIKQLNDMREMLYYERHPTGISQKLVERLEALYREQLSRNK